MTDLFGPPAPREPRDVAYAAGEAVARKLVAKATNPRSVAFGAGYMTAAVVLSGRKMHFLPYIACCYAAGFAARKAWQVAEDVHQLAEKSREVVPDGQSTADTVADGT